MVGRVLLVLLALIVLPAPAMAQPLFGNPFSEASVYRSERRDLPPATYRVVYEATTEAANEQPRTSELIIDVAPDWAVTRQDGRTTLYDYRLNRVFIITGGSFTAVNGSADLVFRVMERQNRTYLQRLTSTLGADLPVGDACDAESELGIVIPGTDAGVVAWREEAGAFTLRCAERDIGVVTPGSGATAPMALWPTLYAELRSHPALLRRVRETGRAPARLENSFTGVGASTRRAWRLVRIETIDTAYPLETSLRNATAEIIDREFVPGIGQVAMDAVAGQALGGAPTLQSWGEHLNTLARREGDAAAAMLILATYNMFPELEGTCNGPAGTHPVCRFNRDLRTIANTDPAPMALLEIGMAEQGGDSAAAIAAMSRAQASGQRDHPALAMTFSLAVLRFDDAAMAQARAANLPTDVSALQATALRGLPYAPTHWADVGDRYASAYDYVTAFVFYDVAYSLPMPSAVARHPALRQRHDLIGRIRRDFIDASLLSTVTPLPVRSQ